MNTIKVHDTVEVTYPDCLILLSEEERQAMNFAKAGEGYVLKNDDLHIMISIACLKLNWFTNLLSASDLRRSAVKNLEKLMRQYFFKPLRFMDHKIGEELGQGFAYEYQNKGIDMYGETYVFKKDKMAYYFHFYTRKECTEEALVIWNELLDGVKSL